MARINYRQCDICEKQLDRRDLQFWLKAPRRARLYFGVPILGMKRYDVCDSCMAEVMVEVQMRSNGRDGRGRTDLEGSGGTRFGVK